MDMKIFNNMDTYFDVYACLAQKPRVIFTFLIPNSASFAPIGVAMSFTFTHMGTINEVSESYIRS